MKVDSSFLPEMVLTVYIVVKVGSFWAFSVFFKAVLGFTDYQNLDIFSLYTKGIVLGYKRGLRNQQPNTSLIRLEGVNDKKETDFYLGKRVAFVYRAKRKTVAKGDKKASKLRVMWGKITRPHGNSGVVRARFRHNLPPKAMGATVRVVCYLIANILFANYTV